MYVHPILGRWVNWFDSDARQFYNQWRYKRCKEHIKSKARLWITFNLRKYKRYQERYYITHRARLVSYQRDYYREKYKARHS